MLNATAAEDGEDVDVMDDAFDGLILYKGQLFYLDDKRTPQEAINDGERLTPMQALLHFFNMQRSDDIDVTLDRTLTTR